MFEMFEMFEMLSSKQFLNPSNPSNPLNHFINILLHSQLSNYKVLSSECPIRSRLVCR
jgi:hypothetical protein